MTKKSHRLFLSDDDYDSNLIRASMRCEIGQIPGVLVGWAYTSAELAQIEKGIIEKARALRAEGKL